MPESRDPLRTLRIEPADAQTRPAGLDVLLSHLPAVERTVLRDEMLRRHAAHTLPLDGLHLAYLDERLAGAILAVPVSDGSAEVWPPVVPIASGVGVTVAMAMAARLLERIRDWMDKARIGFAQCLVEEASDLERRLLREAGFEELAILEFLRRDWCEPLPPPVPLPWRRIPYAPSEEARFATMLERTYVGTLDCPVMNRLRTGTEALASHALAGGDRGRMWSLWNDGRDDVAITLLGVQHETGDWELSYFGVVPERRGHGWGRALVLDAMHRAHDAGVAGISLAVDALNHPARAIYADLGFERRERRAAHFWRRPEPSREIH